MKIYYCEHCDKRVPEEELESGKALLEDGDKGYCAECVTLLEKHRPTVRRRSPTRGNALPGHHAARNTPVAGIGSPVQQISHAHHPHPAKHHPASRSFLPHMVLGVVAMLMVVMASFLFKTPAEPPITPPVVVTPPVTEPPVVVAPPVSTVVANAPKGPAPIGGLFGEMNLEREREMDPKALAAQAQAKLNDANDFYKKYPQDPWTYLELLRAVKANTPAHIQALETIATLQVPVEKSDSPGWYRDWVVENNRKPAIVSMQHEFDDRKNVLKTAPAGKDEWMLFTREMPVPEAPAVLVFNFRGNEKTDCRVAIEVDGLMQTVETIKGNAWKKLALNVGAMAGKKIQVGVRHIATGWEEETIYWSEPVFGAASGSKIFDYDSAAIAYSKDSAASFVRSSKRRFVGSVTWTESERWKDAINLLAVADPKVGAHDSEWKRLNSGAIISGKTKGKIGSRLEIPVVCPPEYDVRSTFERKNGYGDAALILVHPASGKQFIWCIGASSNKYAAIADVGENRFEGNPAAVKIEDGISNNRKYTTVVEVRKDRISCYLDGRILTEWTPDMGPVNLQNSWKLNQSTHVALGSWQSDVVFYSFELIAAE